MGFLKTVPLSVGGKFLKVQLHRVILINKVWFCQLHGKMKKVCFFPGSKGLGQRCTSLGALGGLSSANGSITGQLPWAELGWGWCSPWGARGGGAPLCPGTARSCRCCQGWTRSCNKFSLSLVPRGGFAPERGEKSWSWRKPRVLGWMVLHVFSDPWGWERAVFDCVL